MKSSSSTKGSEIIKWSVGWKVAKKELWWLLVQIPLGRPIRVRSLVVERRLDMAKVASSILAEPTTQFNSLRA